MFKSESIDCEGDFYLPYSSCSDSNDKKFPCIILAHGITGTRDMELFKIVRELFKQNYQLNNNTDQNIEFAVFVFDYRYFGTSGGKPRHYVSPIGQCNDYINALKYITDESNEISKHIDGNNIILMGLSFSGGHVLHILGNEEFKNKVKSLNIDINCAVSIIPYLGDISSKLLEKEGMHANEKRIQQNKWEQYLKRGIIKTILLLYGSFCDVIRAKLGYKSIYSRIWQSRFEKWRNFGFFWIEDSFVSVKEYWARHPIIRKGDWRNALSLRSVLELAAWKPITWIDCIDIPVLYIAAENDNACPSDKIEFAAKYTKNCQIDGIEMMHYEWSTPKNLEQIVKRQLKFMRNQFVSGK